jgi:hypothetical protein
MKKEWIYFIAGAGLAAAIMFFNMTKDSSADCVAVASALKEINPKGLSAHEYQIYSFLKKYSSGYIENYKRCLTLEGKG